ncbi:MAG: hypothetical protein RLZZ182_1730 [Pseudomonadota bacterium]|jgi:predicted metal-dependent hydrolase
MNLKQMLLPWWGEPQPEPAPPTPSGLPPRFPTSSPIPDGMTPPLKSSLLRHSVTAETSTPAVALSVFRHPAAQHEMLLGQVLVGFELLRCKRRSIGMVVSPDGLTVRAPRWATWNDIEQALSDKSRWICAKLVDQRDKGQRQAAARIAWEEGGVLPYLGEPMVMMCVPGQKGCVLVEQQHDLPGVVRRVLQVGVPLAEHASWAAVPERASTWMREQVQRWLQGQALALYQARLAHFSARMGVQMKALKLSSARTRWGSASVDGTIRLQWKLMHFAPSVIDYVVVHELAHLREMNHSPRFWQVVADALPDYEVPLEHLRHVVIPE